jgi:hypothetical protein
MTLGHHGQPIAFSGPVDFLSWQHSRLTEDGLLGNRGAKNREKFVTADEQCGAHEHW